VTTVETAAALDCMHPDHACSRVPRGGGRRSHTREGEHARWLTGLEAGRARLRGVPARPRLAPPTLSGRPESRGSGMTSTQGDEMQDLDTSASAVGLAAAVPRLAEAVEAYDRLDMLTWTALEALRADRRRGVPTEAFVELMGVTYALPELGLALKRVVETMRTALEAQQQQSSGR
jgi:hypothetical protein